MTRSARLAAIILSLFLLSGCGYTALQTKEESFFKAWSDIESTLQRRADLIPNLVEGVKGDAKHEKETLEAVITARAKATSVQLPPEALSDPAAMQQFQAAQGNLSGALSRLLVVAENYPDLKANQNFRDLQHQLEGTENRINVARQRYNETVQVFNTSIRIFPNNLTNSFLLKLERKEPFKADAGAAEAPKVKF